MEIKSYKNESIVAQIRNAAKAADAAGEIVFGVELTQAEYDQLREEIEAKDEIVAYAPPLEVPIYVDGKSMPLEARNRFLLLHSAGSPVGKAN